jgi:hypothetical protein
VTLEKSGQGALMSVANEGKGISRENQKKIFEIFHSDNQGAMALQSHSGIGLTLTKELVELHGGKISVRSKLGYGTVFSVFLPLNEPSRNPDADYVVSDGIVEAAGSFEIETETEQNSSETVKRPGGPGILYLSWRIMSR